MLSPKTVHFYEAKNSPIEIVFLSKATCSYPVHNHISVYTFGLILDGYLKITRSEKTEIQQDGFMIPPYEPHCISAILPYDLVSICIEKHYLSSTPKENLVSSVRTQIKNCQMGSLLSEHHNQLLEHLIQAAIFHSRQAQQQADCAISSLKERIEKIPEHPLSIYSLAHDRQQSSAGFIRSFSKRIGLTPHQFQIQNQIRKAKQLLKMPLSVAEVAQEAGFYDQSHLIRHFKKRVGLTPTDYQKACISLPLS